MRLATYRTRSHRAVLLSLVVSLSSVTCLRPDRGSVGTADSGGSVSSGATASGAASAVGGSSAISGGQGGEAGSEGSSSGGKVTLGGSGGSPPAATRVAGTDKYNCDAPSGDEPVLSLKPYITDLARPVYVTHPPNGETLFILELDGTVQQFDPNTNETVLFLDLADKVEAGEEGGDERGLLGLAFHPQYDKNGLFYLHYSAGPAYEATFDLGDTVIEEYHVDKHGDVEADSGRLVLTVPQPANNHNGGSIAFGIDQLLYVGLGDGGGSGDAYGNGQDPTSLLAAILRINPLASDTEPYTIPKGNLRDKLPEAAPEIWDMGLRNPFRFNFDACTGDLYIGDVGQDRREEIDIELAKKGQKNYGWSTMEGSTCYDTDTCNEDGLTLPSVEYEHDGSGASITGGSVYRGNDIPALRGVYFYADYVTNGAWAIRFDRKTQTTTDPLSYTQDLSASSVVAIQNDAHGELLFVSLADGTIYKLVASP